MAKSGTSENIVGFNEDEIIQVIDEYMTKNSIDWELNLIDYPIRLSRKEFTCHVLNILSELNSGYITIEQGPLGG